MSNDIRLDMADYGILHTVFTRMERRRQDFSIEDEVLRFYFNPHGPFFNNDFLLKKFSDFIEDLGIVDEVVKVLERGYIEVKGLNKFNHTTINTITPFHVVLFDYQLCRLFCKKICEFINIPTQNLKESDYEDMYFKTASRNITTEKMFNLSIEVMGLTKPSLSQLDLLHYCKSNSGFVHTQYLLVGDVLVRFSFF